MLDWWHTACATNRSKLLKGTHAAFPGLHFPPLDTGCAPAVEGILQGRAAHEIMNREIENSKENNDKTGMDGQLGVMMHMASTKNNLRSICPSRVLRVHVPIVEFTIIACATNNKHDHVVQYYELQARSLSICVGALRNNARQGARRTRPKQSIHARPFYTKKHRHRGKATEGPHKDRAPSCKGFA